MGEPEEKPLKHKTTNYKLDLHQFLAGIDWSSKRGGISNQPTQPDMYSLEEYASRGCSLSFSKTQIGWWAQTLLKTKKNIQFGICK